MTSCDERLRIKLRKSLNKIVHHSVSRPGQRIPAAVLVPFICIDGTWNLLFTKRTSGVAKHQGEISFPGGAAEEADTDLIHTALREAYEEIGVNESGIDILGVLEPVPTISNFCVLPVVAIVDWPLVLNINSDEVEKVMFIPVDYLMNNDNWYEQEFHYEPGSSRKVIHYKDYDGEHLWGLTAMMTRTVLELI